MVSDPGLNCLPITVCGGLPTKMGVRPPLGWQHSFVVIDHEIFSMVPLPLIQEGQLSVSCERMLSILVDHFED